MSVTASVAFEGHGRQAVKKYCDMFMILVTGWKHDKLKFRWE